jgi:hypothetical protein
MRFKSDAQRRAVFANMFSKRGKSNLEMFTDELGRLRVSSDTTADTSFLLSTDMEPSETKKFIGELDEEALAGLKSISVVRPKVMLAYEAEPGYYTSDDEKVPFGRLDVPKIVATAERRGRGGTAFVPGVAKDIGRAAFENMYKTAYIPDEEGVSVTSDLPLDLLEEEYLMQVYSDYTPSTEVLDRMESFGQNLTDEVWRIRALQRLGHPSTMEARAWRMGKQPAVDVETFVDIPKRKYEKTGNYRRDAEVEESVEDVEHKKEFDPLEYLTAVSEGKDIVGGSSKSMDDLYKSKEKHADAVINLQKKRMIDRVKELKKSEGELERSEERRVGKECTG